MRPLMPMVQSMAFEPATADRQVYTMSIGFMAYGLFPFDQLDLVARLDWEAELLQHRDQFPKVFGSWVIVWT